MSDRKNDLAAQAAACIRLYWAAQSMMVHQRDALASIEGELRGLLTPDDVIETPSGLLRRNARAKPRRSPNTEALMHHIEDLPVDVRAKIIKEQRAVVYLAKLPAEMRDFVIAAAEKVDTDEKWPTVADLEKLLSAERRAPFITVPDPLPDQIVIDIGNGGTLGVEG